MLRALLLAVLFVSLFPTAVVARPLAMLRELEICEGSATPDRSTCRRTRWREIPVQTRMVWLSGSITLDAGEPPAALHIAGAVSSEVWINGTRVGASGVPGATPAQEAPGVYDQMFRVSPGVWREGPNRVDVRMSGFHSLVRLTTPVTAIWAGGDANIFRGAARASVAWLAAGAVLAGGLYFGALWLLRHAPADGLIALIAFCVVGQCAAETLRTFWLYPYPVHTYRLTVVLILAAVISSLLAGFLASRLAPGRGAAVGGATALSCAIVTVTPMGYDPRTALVLLIGAVVGLAVAAVALRKRVPGALLTMGLLVAYIALLIFSPERFLDLSFYVAIAVMTLALLVAEVARHREHAEAKESALAETAVRADTLAVATGKGIELVALTDIVGVVGADDYAEIRLASGRTLLHAARLDRLAERLPTNFMRVHRSAIANLEHVRAIERSGSGWRLMMSAGAPLSIARARVTEVRARLVSPGTDLPLSHSAAIRG